MTRRLLRNTSLLTLLAALLGAGAFYYVYRPATASVAWRLLWDYSATMSGRYPLLVPISTLGLCAGGLALFLGLAGRFLEVSGRPGSTLGRLMPWGRGKLRRGAELKVGSPVLGTAARLSLFEKIRRRVEHLSTEDDTDMIMLVDEILRGAVMLGASDVHLTSTPKAMDLSFRMDGVLEKVCSIPGQHRPVLISRVRVLSRLDTTMHDVPQDGRLEINKTGVVAEFRVSILPTSHGPKAVLRVVRSSTEARGMEELGMTGPVLKQFLDLVESPQGMIFLTGPTGSGKTTTIYSGLNHIHRQRGDVTNIVSIEDPIEVMLPFLTQTQVNEKVGLTFAKGLRSILRQDPDVIMVGEIRDSETSGIAVQAGLTGHLILTTVHTNSAAGVFNRLIETGVEPFLLASASLGVVSQRLVRRLCPHCTTQVPPTPDEVDKLRKLGLNIKGELFYAAVGCDTCDGRGYAGRIPLFELLPVSPGVRDLINDSVPTPKIHDRAVNEGMVVLLEDGVIKARSGVTTLSEVLRVAAS